MINHIKHKKINWESWMPDKWYNTCINCGKKIN